MLNQILTRTLHVLLAPFGFLARMDVDQQPELPDPLAHPDVQRMSLRELADMPFEPFCLPPQAQAYRSRRVATDRAVTPGTVRSCAACR